MRGVRFREDTGYEGICEYCRQYWPLDLDFWRRGTLRRCRACLNEAEAARVRARRPKPVSVEARARRRARDNERKRIERTNPARRPALLARQREAQQRFYERHRAEVLDARRAAYAAQVGHEPRPGIGRPRMAA